MSLSGTDTIISADTGRLVNQYRERAIKYERIARNYLFAIFFVLFACTLIFEGADKLVSAIVQTEAERNFYKVAYQKITDLFDKPKTGSESPPSGPKGPVPWKGSEATKKQA